MMSLADKLRQAGIVTEDEAEVAKSLGADLREVESRLSGFERRPPRTDKEWVEFEELKAKRAYLERVRVVE